jgi:DNA-binding PadR family transcriptional regulator
MFVVNKDKDGIYSLPVQEIKAEDANILSSGLAIRILKLLVEKPMYPKEIARELKINEQKVYYHIRNLEKAGIVSVASTESKQGAVAKYYRLEHPGFVVLFKELEESQGISNLKSESPFLEPFIRDGKLDALIVVGSPDPHGPEKARSRDGYYGIDLGLFIGTFLNYVPTFNVRLDTEVKEADLKNNLILIGGPIVNSVTGRINEGLPIRFDVEKKVIVSTVSKKSYPNDEMGIIVLGKNPFNKEKSILVVAGKRYSGTRAAIIAFLRYFKELSKGNSNNVRVKARVVEGVDRDSDGIVDDVEFRE